MHLMGDPAGGDDGHLQVLGVAFDGAAQRQPQFVATQRTGNRELQDPDLQRHDLHRPVRLARQQCRHGREKPVIQRLVAEKAHVELIGHQAFANVPRQRRVAADAGQCTRVAAFVGHFVALIHAQGKRAIVVKEKRGHMIVENVEQHVRLLLFQPHLDRLETFKDRRPGSLALFVVIDREADGRGVGDSEATDDTSHEEFLE